MSRIVCVLILGLLTGCATVSTTVEGSAVCLIDPVYTNQEERAALRPKTLETIQANNAILLDNDCVED